MLLSTGNILMVGWSFFFLENNHRPYNGFWHHSQCTTFRPIFFAPLLKSYIEKLWCNCCIQHMQFFLTALVLNKTKWWSDCVRFGRVKTMCRVIFKFQINLKSLGTLQDSNAKLENIISAKLLYFHCGV